MKSRKSNRTRYFLHRVNLHLPGKVSCLSTGLTGSRNNPENCHYLVENIPTVEDINKEYLLLYRVWLLCWIWWVLACFKTTTSHPSSYLEKLIFLWKLEDGLSGSQNTLILIKFNTRTTLDKELSILHSYLLLLGYFSPHNDNTKVGPDQLGPPVRVGSTRTNSDRIKK